MATRYSRARRGAAVVTAFVCGLLFASGFDLTRFGFAQDGKGAKVASAQVQSLAETGSAFEAIADHVTPSVVSIQTQRVRQNVRSRNPRAQQPGIEEFFRNFEPQGPQQQQAQEASGTGFIVSKEGYILTNNHVVADADKVTVTLLDKRSFTAKVIGRDPTTDVAVIKIDGENLPTVGLGNDATVRIGEWVLAIGNPLGLDFTVTAGIVSAKGRGSRDLRGLLPGNYAISDFIQTDAAINPGNSGGPLVNIRGEVIGINGAIASPTGFYTGYGFAIPITLAKSVMDDLLAYGRVRRAVLGIGINDVQPEDAAVAGLKTIEGVKVDGFNPPDDSPAKRAGVEPGDIIITVDGKPVDRVSTLQRIVRTHEPGETIGLEVMRYGKKKSFQVKLTEAPAEERVAQKADDAPSVDGVAYDKLGVKVEPVSLELARSQRLDDAMRGLRITDVAPTGPARDKLVASDIIVAVIFPGPRRAVRSVADLQQVLEKLRDGEYVSLHVYSLQTQQTRVVNVRVGD